MIAPAWHRATVPHEITGLCLLGIAIMVAIQGLYLARSARGLRRHGSADERARGPYVASLAGFMLGTVAAIFFTLGVLTMGARRDTPMWAFALVAQAFVWTALLWHHWAGLPRPANGGGDARRAG